ncbi:MAG: tRNA (guanosine(46)-N7)-methyltransferase TrmB [Pirellulaceae bacterium]
MGRRSLPKVDRTISIAEHYVELDDLQTPWDPGEFFGFSGDLELEIGSGKGLYLLNASGQQPERLFLGIEIAKKYAMFAARRLAKHQRKNARIIRGDAMRFVHEFVPDDSVSALHIYFPDPWWKERHRRRRVINPQMIGDIQRVLRTGGRFNFWTDVEEYFETACATITEHSDLQGPQTVAEQPSTHDMDFRTHFERRMRLNEHPVFRSQFVRR